MSIEKQSTAIKGGKRPGAGRKKGVPNKRTAQMQAAVEASGLTPLEYMLEVLRNEAGDPRDRMAAAIAAAPYIHAKLASVQVSGDKENPVQHAIRVEFVTSHGATA